MNGYAGFQNTINRITAAIGEPALHSAVAHQAIECLNAEVRMSRGLRWYGDLHYGTWWTTCSPAEFDAGTGRFHSTLLQSRSSLAMPAVAEGPWRGTTLRIRDRSLWAEGGGYRLLAGHYFEGSERWDSKARKYLPQWQISMVREFLEAAGCGVSRSKQSTHAGTEATAHKALIRMVKDYLGVDMKIIERSAR